MEIPTDPTRSTESWFTRAAQSTYARLWLVALSFTESSVFLVPPDPLLAAMVFARPTRWVRYTLITAASSIAGAIFGYVVGALLYDTLGAHIIALYGLQVPMERAVELVNNGVFVFTLTMAFTPIPFKVAVLAAGFTKANFLAFFLAAVGGRIARYTFVAVIAKVFGEHFEYIMRRFWWFATVGGFVILGAYGIYVIVTG